MRAQAPGDKIRLVENLEVQGNSRSDAFDHTHLERAPHACDRFLPIAAVHDHLGDH
jgi:hypothetical protein